MTLRPLHVWPTLGLLASLAAPSVADFRQYAPPGAFGGQVETESAIVERGVREARWQFGRFYVEPWFGIRNVSRVSVDRTRGDAGTQGRDNLTATVTAGVRAYLPTNSGLTFAAHALPGYVWWDKISERRRINGLYGVGVFGQVNRATLALSGKIYRDSSFFSRQFEERVDSEERTLLASVSYDLGKGFSIFGTVSPHQRVFRGGAFFQEAERINRDEMISRLGSRYRFGNGVTVGAGIERSRAEFRARPNDPRSNSGTSPIFEVEWKRRPVDVGLRLQLRDLQSDIDPALTFDRTTGRLEAGFRVSGPIRLEAVSYRNLVYSAQSDWAWYSDEATGAAIRMSLRSRASMRIFFERGSNNYQPIADASRRIDDFDVLGATVRIKVRNAQLEIGWTETQYDSNLPNFDRSVTTLISGVRFDGRQFSPWG